MLLHLVWVGFGLVLVLVLISFSWSSSCLSKWWWWVSKISNLKHFRANCQKSFEVLFSLPNFLIISVKKHLASCFFYLIFSWNCFAPLHSDLLLESLCLLSTVICCQPNTYSKLTIIFVIASTVCFLFNV